MWGGWRRSGWKEDAVADVPANRPIAPDVGGMGVISLDPGQPVDLEASLLGGQAHRWRREGE